MTLSPVIRAVVLLLIAAGPALAKSAAAAQPEPAELGVRVEKPVGDGKLFSQGSGVLLGDGLVLTAAHVVKVNPADPKVTVLVEGRRVSGTLAFIDRDSGADLALIKIERAALPLKSRSLKVPVCARNPAIGKPMTVASIGQVTRSTTIAGPDKPPPGPDEPATTLSTGYHHGSSGGGVFDTDTGCLSGILTVEISGRVRPNSPFIDVTRFTPALDIAAFLKKYRNPAAAGATD
ncbi:MAG: trypsin-like peptidase domain-containing protein [Rhodospirillaceae bacterium]